MNDELKQRSVSCDFEDAVAQAILNLDDRLTALELDFAKRLPTNQERAC